MNEILGLQTLDFNDTSQEGDSSISILCNSTLSIACGGGNDDDKPVITPK